MDNIKSRTVYSNVIKGILDLQDNTKPINKLYTIRNIDRMGVAFPHGSEEEIVRIIKTNDYMGWRRCSQDEARLFIEEGTPVISVSSPKIELVLPEELKKVILPVFGESISSFEETKKSSRSLIYAYISNSASSQRLENGIYYLNNRGLGQFIKSDNSSSPYMESGMVSKMGSESYWYIRYIGDGGYSIRANDNTNRYLGFRSNSLNLGLSTLPKGQLTDKYIWFFVEEEPGRFRIQNKYRRFNLQCGDSVGKPYLANYTYNPKVESHNKMLWRCVKTSLYGTSTSQKTRELNNIQSVRNTSINVGYFKKPSFSKMPSNAIWSDNCDFDYFIDNETVLGKIKEVDGSTTFYGKKIGLTRVRMYHKVTGRNYYQIFSVDKTHVYSLSNRRPGEEKIENKWVEARDMHVGDLDLTKLFEINPFLCDYANEYDNPSSSSSVLPPSGPEVLKNNMRDLTIFSIADSEMRSVITKMVNRFLEGTASSFRDSVLTNKVENDEKTIKWKNDIKNKIQDAIKKNGRGWAKCDSLRQFTGISFGEYNYYTNGLKICLNDIWGFDIEMVSFAIERNYYSFTLKITLFDHFGLDDVDMYGSDWYSMFLPLLPFFGSWFVLQRYINCKKKYRPFVTYIETYQDGKGEWK